MRKATKFIISLAVVLIAGLNFIVPAFAQDPFTAIAVGGISGASGAGLFGSMAAMSGINISWDNSGPDPMDAMWNVLNPDHVYFSGEKHEATNIDEDIYDYIQIDIGDWLSAQSDFIVNFAQTYNVEDNDSGQTASTVYFNGVPLIRELFGSISSYDIISLNLTQGGDITSSVGPATLRLYDNNGTYGIIVTYDGNVVYNNSASADKFGQTFNLVYRRRSPDSSYILLSGYFPLDGYFTFSQTVGTVSTQTQIPWTSEEVNLDVFNGWQSAKVKIPSSISQLQTGWTLTDFLGELNRIWSGSGEDNILIEEGSDTPVPPVPPTPIPSTPLGEVPFDDWIDLWGQGIYQQLENQSDALDFIGSNGEDAIEELESIDTSIQDLGDTAESIDTNIGIGNGILGGIRSLAQSAVNYLEGIAEHVGELVEEIVEGTETLIAGILNQIPQAFSVIFGPIKQASSIWHYVVEWITSIGAPFQFIWSMASGTSYYIILPVYASLAAAVVLAFFKRFGR